MVWPVVLAAVGVGIFAAKVAKARTIITGPIPAVIPIPAGWRRAKTAEVTSDALALAKERVKSPGAPGTFVTRETPTGTFGSLTEWHYHEPNGPVKPWGWHHGITILLPK